MTGQILIATDFSQASAPAFRGAVASCKESGAILLVAHVLEPAVPFTVEGYVLPQMYDELAAAVRAAAERKMRRRLRASTSAPSTFSTAKPSSEAALAPPPRRLSGGPSRESVCPD